MINKIKIIIFIFLSLITISNIKTNAENKISDEPPHDPHNVFDYNFFQTYSYINRIKSDNGTKGSSEFNNYDNSIRNINLGYDNNSPYIQFDYGSPGGNGGNDRYVNFQMEFDKRFRNNDNMVDGNNSRIYYKAINKKPIEFNLNKNDNNKILYYDNYTQNGQRVYNIKINLKNMNYHSGFISVKLYFDKEINNEPKMMPYSPLLYVYYKSGSNEYNEYNKDTDLSPEYHIFETAQTLYFRDLINSSINNVEQRRRDLTEDKINKNNLSSHDKSELKKKTNQISKYGSEKSNNHYQFIKNIRYIVNGNKDNPSLINTQQDIYSNLDNLSLLKINSLPDLIFNNASTNEEITNLSNRSMKDHIKLSKFNINNCHLNLNLSTLKNENNVDLNNQYFIYKNKIINPDSSFDYYNINDEKDGKKTYSNLGNIKLHYQKYNVSSGNYHGTATWNLVDGP